MPRIDRNTTPPTRRAPPARPPAGFTLVELLVAVAVMAVLAGLAWQGVGGMTRSREAAQERLQTTQRLQTALAQWSHDLQRLYESPAAPALSFDGAALRLVRQGEAGAQVVVWALRGGRWLRWAGPPTTRSDELQAQWLRSQQLQGVEAGHVTVWESLPGWQLYFWRGNGWSNAQSSGDRPGALPGVPATGSPPAAGTPPAPREQLPQGVRLVLPLPQGALTRDIVLGGARP